MTSCTIITDMEIDIQPGKYVVAVSGGVDSMALLHLLRAKPGLELVVAHFDHGIRDDSFVDCALVRETARGYDLPFVTEAVRLGRGASEATAREARYAFLRRVRAEQDARAIITAHHQDDLLETAILNIMRGTGRRGLTALASRSDIVRPLLALPKGELVAYAEANGLVWREDSTNTNEEYLRNYIRHRLLSKFDAASRTKFLDIIESVRITNRALDVELANLMHAQPHANELDRQQFALLPHAVAKEFLASWLRARDIASFDAKTLERVTIAAKTLAPGSIIDIVGGATLGVTKRTLALARSER